MLITEKRKEHTVGFYSDGENPFSHLLYHNGTLILRASKAVIFLRVEKSELVWSMKKDARLIF
jgi:hypothetical protein